MRWFASGRSLAVGLLFAAACDASPMEIARLVCSTICNCREPSPLPSQQEECISECSNDNDILVLPEACVACIQSNANSCSTLISDCDPVCDVDDEPVPDDPPIPVDALTF